MSEGVQLNSANVYCVAYAVVVVGFVVAVVVVVTCIVVVVDNVERDESKYHKMSADNGTDW